MRIAVRRRIAAGGALLSSALVAGVLVTAGPAQSAATAQPSFALNNETKRIVFTTTRPVEIGSTVEFVHLETSDTFTAMVDQNAAVDRNQPSVSVNFADPDVRSDNDPRTTDRGEGPANPDPYRVIFRGASVTSPGPEIDRCESCFTVVSPGAPTLTAAEPNGLERDSSLPIVFTGTNFARDSRIEVLPLTAGTPSGVTVTPPADRRGAATATTLRRVVEVASDAPLGTRDVRVTNTDGQSGLCRGCFTVRGASLDDVSPRFSTNNPTDDAVRVTFTLGTGTFASDAVPSLRFDGPSSGSATKEQLSLSGRDIQRSETQVSALFDFRAAAPGQNAYVPTVSSASRNNVNVSASRFTVVQPNAPTVVGTAPSTQPAGTSQTITVSGTGFARGAVVRIVRPAGNPTETDTFVEATDVQFVSPTTLNVRVTLPANAPTGPRNVRVLNTDGASGMCTGCYTVTAAASASPTATSTATATPSATATASATPTATATRSATPTATATRTATVSPTTTRARPTLRLPRSTITSQEGAVVEGTAEPGSVVQLHAYSRPSTTYKVVREGVVGENGRITFRVNPSGNTRMFLRSRDVNGGNRADSGSVVLTVRTSINLKVARIGTKTYRFTGSTLPKRRGQLVTVFYQADGGNRVIASRARVSQTGTYAVTRRFAGTGTFTLFTATGTDINNAGNESNRVRTTLR